MHLMPAELIQTSATREPVQIHAAAHGRVSGGVRMQTASALVPAPREHRIVGVSDKGQGYRIRNNVLAGCNGNRPTATKAHRPVAARQYFAAARLQIDIGAIKGHWLGTEGIGLPAGYGPCADEARAATRCVPLARFSLECMSVSAMDQGLSTL